jgi:hypothetical protein
MTYSVPLQNHHRRHGLFHADDATAVLGERDLRAFDLTLPLLDQRLEQRLGLIEFWPQKPMPQLPSQPDSMSAPLFMPASASVPTWGSRARSAKLMPGCFLKTVV